jgi:type II secretory pathway component GspD/PulD (secretin)
MIRMLNSHLRSLVLIALMSASPIYLSAAESGAGEDNQVKILRTNNKAQANKYVGKVYDFKSNNPYNVRRFLQRPLAAEEGAIFTYVNPDYKSGMVLLICPPHQLAYFDRIMPYLDQPGQGTADGSIRDFIKLENRSVADSGFISAITTQMTTDSWLYTDTELNGIYISDAPSGYNAVQAFLSAEGSVPREQIDVSVSIYEVDLSNDQRIGVDYMAWKNGPGQEMFNFGAFGEAESANNLDFDLNDNDATNTPLFDSGAGITGLPGQQFHAGGYHGTYFLDVPSQYFDYLSVDGRADLVGKSRISVLNGETGSFDTVDRLVFYESESDGDHRSLEAKLVNTGLQLEITPIIGTETINLEIQFDSVSLSGFDGSGRPLTASTSYFGESRVLDGEEIVLAGLKRTVDIENSSKIPVLGSIPLLGKLFGGNTDVSQDTMVAIVLRPTVVRGAGSNFDAEDKQMTSNVCPINCSKQCCSVDQ